ncbi:MAG: hypothetical protein OXO50_18485 [Caldilineaceae bacterium]|nr:hypothetical protein [Caldilineaceae bacterium]MDE0534312.1 hypothetical protein [Albidovulum sp.]
MANGTGDHDPAFKAVDHRIPAPVLEGLQLLSVAGPEAVSVHENIHQLVEPTVLLWSIIKEFVGRDRSPAQRIVEYD